jgi:WD40 repeat protein
MLLACQPAPEPVADAAPSDPPRPELVLTGPLGLRVVGSLGLGGRQIVFIDDARWLSSAGYQVTLWEGSVPTSTFHLDAYNYLEVSSDGLRVFGDHEVVDLASSVKSLAFAVEPAVLGEQPPQGREIEHLRATPDGALGLLEMRWRPPPGMPETDGEGERSYRYAYPNSPPADMEQWYLVDGRTGATLLTLPAGNSPFSAFSPGFIAIGGTPKEGEISVVSRPTPAIVATLSMGMTYVNQVDISPDERWLLAADNTGKVALWDTSAWAAGPTTWAAHDEPTGGIAFHPHAPLLATTGFDDTLKLWRLEAGGGQPELVTSLALAGQPLAIAFAPSGLRLHVGVERHDAVTESIAIVELTP